MNFASLLTCKVGKLQRFKSALRPEGVTRQPRSGFSVRLKVEKFVKLQR